MTTHFNFYFIKAMFLLIHQFKVKSIHIQFLKIILLTIVNLECIIRIAVGN